MKQHIKQLRSFVKKLPARLRKNPNTFWHKEISGLLDELAVKHNDQELQHIGDIKALEATIKDYKAQVKNLNTQIKLLKQSRKFTNSLTDPIV